MPEQQASNSSQLLSNCRMFSSSCTLALTPVSDVLRKLPLHGVGCRVARDTWAPESGRYWDIAHVMTRKVGIIHHPHWHSRNTASVLSSSSHHHDKRRFLTPMIAAAMLDGANTYKFHTATLQDHTDHHNQSAPVHCDTVCCPSIILTKLEIYRGTMMPLYMFWDKLRSAVPEKPLAVTLTLRQIYLLHLHLNQVLPAMLHSSIVQRHQVHTYV